MVKQLHVNLFEMNCVSHITHGLWRHPDNNRHRFNDIEFWTELAQLLEHGTFDGVFLADVVGVYDDFNDSAEVAIREGLQIPNNDPLLLVPAMAAVTKNLGFGVTFSTTYEPPFAFARRMSTLDHLTKGRIGWNIVTSYLRNAARNFGRDDEVPHDRRYEIADEYLEVLYKLWEGSWDEDAVIQDRENGVYTDPSKVRYINHVGENFRVAGPHLCEPSRQRTPFLLQATASPAGVAFAGRHAEVVFTGALTREGVRDTAAQIRASLTANGRDPNAVKIIPMANVIVGRNDVEVADKVAAFNRLKSEQAYLAHLSFGLDLTKFSPSELIGDIVRRKEPGSEKLPSFLHASLDATVGQALARLTSAHLSTFAVAGTPNVVADEIERWLDEDGVDGFNLVQWLSFDTARDFIELVVPELRRRGRFRTAYNEGETLRERFFGAGNSRLPAEHAGAKYRDPSALTADRKPLRLDHGDQSWWIRTKKEQQAARA